MYPLRNLTSLWNFITVQRNLMGIDVHNGTSTEMRHKPKPIGSCNSWQQAADAKNPSTVRAIFSAKEKAFQITVTKLTRTC